MPYESLALKLLETYEKEGSFDVDYLDPAVAENVAKHLRERGCTVTAVSGTKLHVVCPLPSETRSS